MSSTPSNWTIGTPSRDRIQDRDLVYKAKKLAQTQENIREKRRNKFKAVMLPVLIVLISLMFSIPLGIWLSRGGRECQNACSSLELDYKMIGSGAFTSDCYCITSEETLELYEYLALRALHQERKEDGI
jgi:hypothetical protein